MDLWIRSQNRNHLYKIDNVYVEDYNGYYYVCTQKNGNEIKLGEYGFHTKSRALEVLDEIQSHLSGKWIRENFQNYKISYIYPIIFYEMPKE